MRLILLLKELTLPLGTLLVLLFEIIAELFQDVVDAVKFLLCGLVQELQLSYLGIHFREHPFELLLLNKVCSINSLDGLENLVKEGHALQVVFLVEDILKLLHLFCV